MTTKNVTLVELLDLLDMSEVWVEDTTDQEGGGIEPMSDATFFENAAGDELEIRKHGSCYEITLNGELTVTVDRR